MARFESDSLTKRSSKFENFLKKNLDESTYERIRAYEPCIVCSHREQKAFKYVVLSDECLYLTENPPKTLSTAVKLENLFEIDLIDDLPDFLSGQEQRNTTHIQINYWDETVAKVKPSSRPSSQNSMHQEDTDQEVTSSSVDKLSAARSKLDLDDDSDGEVVSDPMSKSMPEGSLKSMLKQSHPNGRHPLKSTFKKVTIQDQSRIGNKHVSSKPEHKTDNNLSVPTPDQQVGSKVSKKMTLHLYMLVPDSKMLVLIRSAVNNFLIRSTLYIDSEELTQDGALYLQKGKHSSDMGGKTLSVKIDMLFSTLTKELMDPGNTMEQTFELVQELKTATEKYFHLKRLFWKSGDIFAKLVSILKVYLPKSPHANINNDLGRAQRADEFELIILIIQTIGLMFRETEIFPSRLRVLRSGSGRLIQDLIEVITCFPSLPVKYVPPTSKASKLLMQTEADKWKCLADMEIHELFVEFTSASTSVLFELLVIAQQSHWGRSENSFFNVNWLMNVLENLNTTPSKKVELSPQEAILVFQEFYIQHAIMVYSPPLASFISNNYTEEFKYYIQGPVLQEKLPEFYPISMRTILLIQEVMSQVLQKKVQLLPEKRFIQ
ncbi:C12orf56 [Bugula neritina]|uniref:C12orf56 n=1 Tax=Bugula neritina TaxID=10212 RepID=A0A7J7KT59_BUGNE|nr:C12orf56 [Bugula neritina]